MAQYLFQQKEPTDISKSISDSSFHHPKLYFNEKPLPKTLFCPFNNF